MRLGMWELLAIAVLLVFLFGAKRIPELMGGIGEGIKNFKKSVKGDEGDEAKSKEA